MLAGTLASLAVLVVLLAVPVTFDFRVSWPRPPRPDVVLGWGFGLVRLRIPAGGPAAESTETRPQGRTRRRRSRGKRKWNMTALVRRKAARRRLTRFLVDLWRAVHKKNVDIDVRLGLADPADTGQLWAFAGPLAGMLAGNRDASVHLEPDFTGETVQVNGSGTVRLIPLRIIGLVLALLLSPSIWAALAESRRTAR